MQLAINDLLSSGFDRAELSLLAAEETVNEKLGHKYKKVAEIEDDATVPRTRYISQEAISEGEYVFTGGLVLLGTLGAVGTIVASGAISGCDHRGGFGRRDLGLLGNCSPDLLAFNTRATLRSN